MIYRSTNWGFLAVTYNPVIDEHEWSLLVGFGGPYQREPGTVGGPYRYGFHIVWRKLTNCVNWWADYLGVERGRGVVVNYRVHSFKQFPISIEFYRAPQA